MKKDKRERSANFTIRERDLLVTLVKKYKHVIENKQNDGRTWKKKEYAWRNIEQDFNARSGGIYRSVKTLKIKYEGLKRCVRKKSAAIRSKIYCKGGGTNTAEPLDHVESQVKAMITQSVDGLTCKSDPEHLPDVKNVQDDDKNKSIDDSAVDDKQTAETSNGQKNISSSINLSQDSYDDTEDSTNNEDVVDVNTPLNVVNTSRRRKFRKKKHSILSCNYTSPKTSLDELTEAKIKVTQLQEKILETELAIKTREADEKIKEWEFAAHERMWREEKVKLEIEILKKQLNKD